MVADVEAGLTVACGAGCRACVFLILAVLPESPGTACVPPIGVVGPASITSPVVAPGELVSVPDNLLKICKAKPVIFKGKCGLQHAVGWGGWREARGTGYIRASLRAGSRGVLPGARGHSRQVPTERASVSTTGQRPAPPPGTRLLVHLCVPSSPPAASPSSCRCKGPGAWLGRGPWLPLAAGVSDCEVRLGQGQPR